MEIQKVFSDYYDTERMYSVLMSEDELRLFALRDYAGLTKDAAKRLKFERNQIAKELRNARKGVSKAEAQRLDPYFKQVSVPRIGRDGYSMGEAAVKMKDKPNIVRENLLNISNSMANNAREVSAKKSGGFFSRMWDRFNTNTRPIAKSRFEGAFY